MALPSPEAMEALTKLSEDPKNVVYIISGRDSAFLDQHLGHLTKLGFSAEHGGFIKKPILGTNDPEEGQWTNLTEKLDMSWMSEVKEIFEYYTERTTGCFIEMKKSSITWHYRGADPEWGYVILSKFCGAGPKPASLSPSPVFSNVDSASISLKPMSLPNDPSRYLSAR